ncbi:MAG: hypothetical protein ACI88A_001795 [Paraglaciecola sp.]|jgi:hypothetical protein
MMKIAGHSGEYFHEIVKAYLALSMAKDWEDPYSESALYAYFPCILISSKDL